MYKLFIALFFLVATCVISPIGFAAEQGHYIAVGSDTFKYDAFKQSKVEERVLEGATSSFTARDTSTRPELVVGYCVNRYFCGDVEYSEIRMGTSTKVTSVNGGAININGGSVVFNGTTYSINGTSYNLGPLGTDITLSRNLDASLVRFSVSGEYPLTERFGLLGRAGVYYWKAHVLDKLALDSSGIYLSYDEYDNGHDLMASGGLTFKLTDRVMGSVEYSHIKHVTMTFARLILMM